MNISNRGQLMHQAMNRYHLVTTHALIQAGLDHNAIRQLTREGHLQRIIRGLYRLPGTRTIEQDIAAALMRHPSAFASHRTALFLHWRDHSPPRKPQLTIESGSTTGSALARLQRSPLAHDTTVVGGLRPTTLARSIVDCGSVLPLESYKSVLDWAFGTGAVTFDELSECAERLEAEPGRIGHQRLRLAVAGWSEEIKPGSPAEARVLRRIQRHGLPMPVTQHEIFDRDGHFVARVDLAWPGARVVREYDSDRFHGAKHVERDELREQRIERLGWSTGSIVRDDLSPNNNGWLDELGVELRRAS